MFLFFNCYQIPQLNWRLKRLAVIPQSMALLVKILVTILEKSFFPLINASACPKMLEWSPLDVKEKDMFFRA